jgi:DNA-binding NarL/FixJ family response regulator
MVEITDITSLKIMLVDDHIMFSQGLSELLKKVLTDVQVKVFSSTEKAKQELAVNEYHFLLSDMLMPGYNVKEFITHCKKKHPSLNIIILSSVLEIQTIKEFLALGIDGYLTKAVNAVEMKMALELIYNGEKYISSDISGKLATSFFEETKSPLTKKELEILRMVAAGNSVIQAAEQLFLSPSTVMAHRRNIMTKLDLHSAAELVKYAYENKLT